jgi:tryptophanyl-tRNA synthetase
MPGLDGEKMSKSYNNTIQLREPYDLLEQKIRKMPTDPARVRRDDPGTPEKCPVWGMHKVYSTDELQNWVREGCTSAGIGCLDCKKPLIDSIEAEIAPIRERAQEYENSPGLMRNIITEGAERAREVADETMEDVKRAMGLNYQ